MKCVYPSCQLHTIQSYDYALSWDKHIPKYWKRKYSNHTYLSTERLLLYVTMVDVFAVHIQKVTGLSRQNILLGDPLSCFMESTHGFCT